MRTLVFSKIYPYRSWTVGDENVTNYVIIITLFIPFTQCSENNVTRTVYSTVIVLYCTGLRRAGIWVST